MQDQDEIASRAAREVARRLIEEPHRFFEPTGKGEDFIRTVGENKHFITLFSAANGIGKTATAINILAHLFFPCGNRWFQHQLFRDFPFSKRGRIISDATNIKENIAPELSKWLPRGKYEKEKRRKDFDSYWRMKGTDWEFDIMTYDQDPKEFEAVTLGWAWFDEPPPEAIYKATVARMRRGGIIWITATPLTGSAWMYDEILANKNNDIGLRTYLEADVESACKTHGVRGFLDHANIEKMISQYSEEDKQARIHGKFQHLTGLIFKQFHRNVHVIPPFEINQRDFCVVEMLDPHPRNPDAALWIAVNRKGQKFVIDELYFKGQTEEIAQRIKNKASQYRIVRRLIDPSAFVEDQHTSRSLASRFMEFGLSYLPASKTRAASDRRISDALNYTKVGEEMIRAPEIFIFDTCQRTIYEMEHYRWQEWKGKSAGEKSPNEKPVDKDDHMIENLGRALIQEPTFEPLTQNLGGTSEIPALDPYE